MKQKVRKIHSFSQIQTLFISVFIFIFIALLFVGSKQVFADSPPNTPSLDSPANGATNQSLRPALKTTATDPYSDYLRYKIQVCTDPSMITGYQTFDQTVSQTGWSGQNTQSNTAYTSGTQATYTLQTNLTPNTTYYWRSYAIDPGGTNTWSNTQTPYSFTTSASPTAPTDLLTEGATNPSSITDQTPEFSAIHHDPNGDSANYYEIEVNTAPDFSGTVMWDSGQQSMTAVANGARSPDISYAGVGIVLNGSTYYWRIRFWDTFGLVSPWSNVQNFAVNNIPNTPTLNSPANGATNQSLRPALKTTATDSDSDYLRYKIQVCTNSSMTTGCQTFDQTVSQTGWSGQNTQSNTAYTSGTQATYTLQTNLTPNTTYYWRSYAIDPGGTNTWSNTQTPYSFTTSASPTAPTDLLTEGATNPSSITDQTPEFSAIHHDPNGDSANYYEIEVNTAPDFSGTVMWDSGQQSMTAVANGARSPDISYAGVGIVLNGSTYYWRIRFWDTFGLVSPWSNVQNFALNSPPNTPSLNSPANGATNQSLRPALKTTATDPDSDYLRYKIQLCTDSSMTTGCQTFDQTSSQTGWSGQNTQTNTAYSSGTQATYTLQNNLAANTTYYWRSYAIDPGGTNTWSNTQTPYSFTTSASPTAPTDLLTEGAINPISILDTTPEFSAIHHDPNGDSANYYEIEVNTAADFSGTVMWDSGQQSMTAVANGARSPDISYAGVGIVLNGSTYYWRIRFWDTFGLVSPWSNVQNFAVNNIPNTPTLDSPIQGETNVSFRPVLLTTGRDSDIDYLRYKIELCTNLAMTANCQTFDQTSSQTGWSGQNTQSNTAYTSGTQATYTLQTNLVPNTVYYWRSYAADPVGTNTWSATQATPHHFTTLATPLPADPCFVQESLNDNQLLVVWTDNADNENYYEVQRSVDSGIWSVLQTSLPANTVNLLDNTVNAGHTYQYRVAPYFTTGPSYAAWCTTSKLNLGLGLFNLEGIKASGLKFN